MIEGGEGLVSFPFRFFSFSCPLAFPVPFILSLPFSLLPFPLSFLLLELEIGPPKMQLRSLGERCKFLARSGAKP